MNIAAITKTAYFGTTLSDTTAHVFNRVLPENLPCKTKGQTMSRPAWEKRVASALLKAARVYARVYQYDYGHDSNTSGAEDFIPEGWDTSEAIKALGCDLAIEEHVFDQVVNIAFEATEDTGWRKSYDSERWTRVLTYVSKSAAWLEHECDRLCYRSPGFWSDEAQVEYDGETTKVTLVSHNEGEL